MSIVFETVADSICEKAVIHGATKFVWASIDPTTKHQLNLPSDFKYYPVFMPDSYIEWADRFQNFKVRKDDIWITGFPKTGTTWIHNILRQMINGLDFSAPARMSGEEYFDLPMWSYKKDDDQYQKLYKEFLQIFDQRDGAPSPRILKTHMPSFLIPKDIWTTKSKVIYITRNPKDAIVSQYYMYKNGIAQYKGTMEDLCDLFLNDHMPFTPFFEHLLSFWQLRHLDNVLFLTYEELSADLFGGVKRINQFLGGSYTDEQLKQLTEYASFGNMQKVFKNSIQIGSENIDTGHR